MSKHRAELPRDVCLPSSRRPYLQALCPSHSTGSLASCPGLPHTLPCSSGLAESPFPAAPTSSPVPACPRLSPRPSSSMRHVGKAHTLPGESRGSQMWRDSLPRGCQRLSSPSGPKPLLLVFCDDQLPLLLPNLALDHPELSKL